MKKHYIINLLVLLTIGFCFSNFSCSKDDDDTNSNNNGDQTTTTGIVGKWKLIHEYFYAETSQGHSEWKDEITSDVFYYVFQSNGNVSEYYLNQSQNPP